MHPDNDKALIPPGSIPGLVNLVSTVELPKPYHSDAKATHELFHSFLHRRLSVLPGTVIPNHPGRDPRYDPVSEAEISRAKFAYAVELARRAWNNEPKASLGNRSPIQALRAAMKVSPTRFIPPADVEMELGRTVEAVGADLCAIDAGTGSILGPPRWRDHAAHSSETRRLDLSLQPYFRQE